jgi:flavorubredoxin
MAQTGLKKYYCQDLPIQTVKTGDSISIGKRTIQFLEVPMLHWPDSMFSYIPEEKLLLSNDGFGQHIASSGRFDDEVPEGVLMYEAKKYYANLLIHLSPLIQNTLKKVTELKLEIDMIGPSHGVIWKKNPGKIIQAYDNWSQYKAENKFTIVYDTMWKSTEKMALSMADVAVEKGMEVTTKRERIGVISFIDGSDQGEIQLAKKLTKIGKAETSEVRLVIRMKTGIMINVMMRRHMMSDVMAEDPLRITSSLA